MIGNNDDRVGRETLCVEGFLNLEDAKEFAEDME